jgi:beta-barrel assembly-enhancing protease
MTRTLTLRGALLLIIAAALVASCQVDPLTGKKTLNLYSYDDEKKMGDEAVQPILAELGGLYPDAASQAYLETVGQKVVKAGRTRLKDEAEFPDWDFKFYLVNTSMINAFALPGGHVFVTRGILNRLKDEAELAGLLGHEVAHVFARHGVERMSEITLMIVPVALLASVEETQGVAVVGIIAVQLLAMSYSRANEEESDHFGMRFAARAGYHPAGVIGVMQMLKDYTAEHGGGQPEFLSTHPDPGNRVDYLNKQLDKEYPNIDPNKYARGEAEFTGAMVDVRNSQPSYDLADKGDAEMGEAFKLFETGGQQAAMPKYRSALSHYQQAASNLPHHAILHVNVAQAQYYLQDYEAAEVAITKALKLESNTFWPNFMGGMVAIQREDNVVAQQRLTNALNLVSGSPITLFYLGVSHERQSQKPEAVGYYRRCYEALQGQGELAEKARQKLIELGEADPKPK